MMMTTIDERGALLVVESFVATAAGFRSGALA